MFTYKELTCLRKSGIHNIVAPVAAFVHFYARRQSVKEEAIIFCPGKIDREAARRDWRKAIRPIVQRDHRGRWVGPELEEDTDRRYEACRRIMVRLLGASNSRRRNNYGFVRELLAEVRARNELMILAQDYVVFATEHGMFDEALEACTEHLFPVPVARFEAYAHILGKWPSFHTEQNFIYLRQLAKEVENPDHDPGARRAAWCEVWNITHDERDRAHMEAESEPNFSTTGAVPQQTMCAHA
jgi:hypothetical protein